MLQAGCKLEWLHQRMVRMLCIFGIEVVLMRIAILLTLGFDYITLDSVETKQIMTIHEPEK